MAALSPPATAGTSAQAGPAAARADALERLLGDPLDPANPHGSRALLDADERRLPPEATEDLLTGIRFGAEFVPVELGGRLTAADDLVRMLRPILRRDVALGFGYGVTSLNGVSAVWAAGDRRQRAATADRLLAGGRATILHRELAHANAILRDGFTATPVGDGFRLGGLKDVVINADRADLLVVYARTAERPGPRSHSVLLLDPAGLPPGGLRRLPRVPTPGMRGCLFSGLEFTGCRVPGDTLVGELGDGVSLELRTFQTTRGVVLGTAVAGVDSVLRHAVHAATAERADGRPDRRWHRVLAGVFADVLACDSLAVTALRALTLLPDSSHLTAAVGKYVMPTLLHPDLEELATVLGGRGYDRGPRYGGFQKLLRDLPVAGLGHAGTASCQAVLVPQLRGLARGAWFQGAEPPVALYRPEDPLPGFDYRRIGLSGSEDVLAATLVGAAGRLADRRGDSDPHLAALAELAESFALELRALQGPCADLPAEGPGPEQLPAACVLADRYVLVVSAAACLGLWEAHRGGPGFLADPAWALLALHRIGRRLGVPVPELPDGVTETVLAEVLRRFDGARSFDLYDSALAAPPLHATHSREE